VDTIKQKAEKLLAEKIQWAGVKLVFDEMSMMSGPPGAGMSKTTIKVRGDDPTQVYGFA
jgi:hypothetical protein